MIDICIIATRRPELLERTLNSFKYKLFCKEGRGGFEESNYRLIINVDPVGEDVSSESIVDIARSYFPNVVCRISDIPNFPQAWIWCWLQVKNRYVFHLEEDWELLRPLNFAQMIGIMELNPYLVHLRLSTWRSEDKLKQWKWFLEHKNGYYQVPNDVKGTIGFCGHPGLCTDWFVQTCLTYINPSANPEKQIKWRNKELWKHIGDYEYGVFQEPNSPASIKDIGRKWMVEHGFQKKGNREHFIEWEKVK